MQVTNVQDRVTHAVIGGGGVQAFQISESAEFFHILSSSLYSDKQLAVIREVLCNAWDAHIEAGCEEIPVDVILNGDKLIIKDFGPGISPSQIVQIYGTYGNSTKQHDGKQTGGFGLGSKSPFSYVDHFEVISCHLGEKTIYKMSLSSAVVGGKPSIATIVTIPTDETGITVSINLKDREDRRRFERLIEQITWLGDMNVKLNGNTLRRAPFSKAQHGFMLIDQTKWNDVTDGGRNGYLKLRYGNVVYPIADAEAYSNLYEKVENILKQASTGAREKNDYYYGRDESRWFLVLQAAPHTISVTPSRESLSMTEQTTETITNLLQKFLDYAEGTLQQHCMGHIQELYAVSPLLGSPFKLIESDKIKAIPFKDKIPVAQDQSYVTDFDQLSRFYLRNWYPNFNNFKRQDILMRLDVLIKGQFGNRGLMQTFKAAMLKDPSLENATTWFHKRVIWPLIKGMTPASGMRVERLYVYSEATVKKKYSEEERLMFMPVKLWKSKSLESYLPFLRNTIILSHSRELDRALHYPMVKHYFGKLENTFFYSVARKAGANDVARAYFEGLGMSVIDLTVRQRWEPAEIKVAPSEPIDRKPKAKGLPCLKAGLPDNTQHFSTNKLFAEDVQRIDNPVFLVKVSPQTNNQDHIGPKGMGWKSGYVSPDVTRAVTILWGELGGVVANSNQEAKYIAMGAKTIHEWLPIQMNTVIRSKEMMEFYANSVDHRKEALPWGTDQIFKTISLDPQLRNVFKLPKPPTARQLEINKIWSSFDRYTRDHNEIYKELVTFIEAIPLNKEIALLVRRLKKSSMLRIIDHDDLHRIILAGDTKDAKKARDILLTLIEG